MGFDNECILNIQSLPGEYFCPVCRTLVYPHEALQAQCTHLYCKPCLAYVVATTRACPYDGYLVTEADAKPLTESNKPIADAINKIQVHCLYHRSGCQWQGSLSECISHCTTCSYGNSPVVCNRCGTQIIHRQVQEHAQICPGVQPQPQQAGATQPPASADQNQLATQPASQASQQAAAQANTGATASLPAAPANAAASAPTAATGTSNIAAPAAVPGQAMAITQSQAVAQAPTPEQWYQQQQLQYQQYYQQYPGYDPYQQQAQYQQQAYAQYPQAHMQPVPQTNQVMQQNPTAYAQPQPQTVPQPQVLQQAQPQQPQALPQPQQIQAQQQPQLQPYGHTPQMQVPGNPQHVLAPAQQPHPQMQPQANPQLQMPVVAQQVGHHPQAHPPAQTSQVQTPVHLQHQQLMSQQHPQAQLQQPPVHPQQQPQLQSQGYPRPQIQQYPQMQPQLPPQPQPQPQQAHPAPQSMPPQQPAAHAVTGHQSYPQPQQLQQILPGPPQQRPSYMQPPQQGVPQQLPQHPMHMQSQPPPQQQLRPSQSHGMQAQHATMPLPQLGHHPNQPPVQQQIQQHPGMHHPPAQLHGMLPQSGRSQVNTQHAPFPLQSAGLSHATHPQGVHQMQQHPPPHSQMPQSGPASQGMMPTSQQVQGMVPLSSQGAPHGGSPAPSRLRVMEQKDSKFDVDVKGTSGPSVAQDNAAELSGYTTQKQDGDFKQNDKSGNSIGDSSKDEKKFDSSTDQATKEENAGMPSGQSEGAFAEGDENNTIKTVSQGSGEEDGRTDTPKMVKAETEEQDNNRVPSHTPASNANVAQSLSKGPDTSRPMPIQQGPPSVHQLSHNQMKTSPSFPYPGSAEGEQRPQASPPFEKYPNQMAPYEMQHVPSQRPSGPDRMLPQHIPQTGPDHDRRFQAPPSNQMPPPGHSHMRPSGPGFGDQMPPGSFHSEQPGGGFIDPGLQRGPNHLGPQKNFEPSIMANQFPPQGHLGPRAHAGPLPGPPLGGPPLGTLDSRETMLARGPPPFHETPMNAPLPPFPMQDDKFSGKPPGPFDGRQSDLRPPMPMEYGPPGQYSGPSPGMMKPNGVTGNVPDSLSHGPLGDRFPSLADERFKPFPEGFKPHPDERFRQFPADPVRRMREFEEDLKQFPRHPISDGEGVSRFDHFSRPLDRGPPSWGPDAGSLPFDKSMKPFGPDGGPKYDMHAGGMASRIPPFSSDSAFGDRHFRDDFPKKPDFNQFDNAPFGGRDLSELSSNRFEGGSAHGLNNQSRFKDYGFGERSRPPVLSEPFGGSVHGSRYPLSSAPFDALETSRMIEQFGSGNPKIGELDGPDFMTGKPRIGEPFGNHMPGLGSGSPRGFHSHAKMDEQARFGFLPPHLRNREPGFGGSFPSHGFSKESGPFSSGAIHDDMYSSEPFPKRVSGSVGWCRICKIDCETVEGLDLHSQTREHQKVAMDIVLRIKRNSSKKQKLSEENMSLDDPNNARKIGFEGRGNRL